MVTSQQRKLDDRGPAIDCFPHGAWACTSSASGGALPKQLEIRIFTVFLFLFGLFYCVHYAYTLVLCPRHLSLQLIGAGGALPQKPGNSM